MKRKLIIPLLLSLFTAIVLISCVDKNPSSSEELNTQALTSNQPEMHGDLIKPGDIELTTPLNTEWVASGKGIYELKCQACHRLTGEKLVGPGWAGVTERRQPEWIMNMITNVEIMLEQDPVAQKQLEECLVRMPNQNLTRDEARQVLEFMRSNDGAK